MDYKINVWELVTLSDFTIHQHNPFFKYTHRDILIDI